MMVCKKCGKNKESDQFHDDHNTKTGKKSSCKECRSEYDRLKYLMNKESIKDYNRKYKEENRDRVLKVSRESYQRNIERNREYARNYYHNVRKVKA